MSRFNTAKARATGRGPIGSERTPTGITHEGRPGFRRDAKSELFLLAVANMHGKDTFYEKGSARETRFGQLIPQVAVEDPEWTRKFLGWLRSDANMRTSSLVGALEACRAMLAAKIPGGRQIIDSVLQRADEPGEALAYWMTQYGRKIPMPVKRGIGDAAIRLYSEFPFLKYDTSSHGFRFADVLELCHPGDRQGSRQRVKGEWQRDLFAYALDKRHGRRETATPETLAMVRANAELRALLDDHPYAALDTDRLRAAGMTWEDVLSAVGSKVDKGQLWEALVPVMGFMALLRNLRNFDQTGVPDEVAEKVAARLANPEQVARSRQLPFRFYSAFKAVGSLRWSYALEKALHASLANVPELSGRTLVLVDQSPSMFPGYGFSSKQHHPGIENHELAKLFGTAVALRAKDATLAGYGQTSYRVPVERGDALLQVMSRFHAVNGTETFRAIHDQFRDHDRVVIVTDEQDNGRQYTSLDQVLPAHVPVYTWNIGGYKVGALGAGQPHRHTFGGLTDAGFRTVPLLEAGYNADWPWISQG